MRELKNAANLRSMSNEDYDEPPIVPGFPILQFAFHDCTGEDTECLPLPYNDAINSTTCALHVRLT